MTAQVRLAQKLAPADTAAAEFARDVLNGLRAEPKRLPAKYFYDAVGSRLFEQITTLPEYYLTRTELGILADRAVEVAQFLPKDGALIEFGSGPGRKAHLLLAAAPHLDAYVPVDISSEFLHAEAEQARHDFPDLSVLPIQADFTRPFRLPPPVDALPRAGFFPGSTIGNFEPHEACAFLRHAGDLLGRGAVFVVGVDLIKDRAILNAAYNDSAGVTAAFNLNLLARINRELGANFNRDGFEHHAFYNRELHRIEMHLASIKRQKVKICGETIELRAGETIHTENSYKYTIESFTALARGSGWGPRATWTDPVNHFSIHAMEYET